MTGRFLFDDETGGCSHTEAAALGASFVDIYHSITYVDTTDAVRRVYDALRQSMDYGSGMLDTEDMRALLLIGTLLDASDLRDLRADIKQASMGVIDPHTFDSDRTGGTARCLQCGGYEYQTAHDQDNPACPVCGSTRHTSTEQHQRLVNWATGLRAHGHPDTADAVISQLIIDPVFVAWDKTEHDAAIARAERERVDRRLAAGVLDSEDF